MITEPGHDPRPCRVKGAIMDPDTFTRHSCAMCCYFLFPSHPELEYIPPYFLAANNRSVLVSPHPANESTMQWVCHKIQDSDGCSRWRQCCEASVTCCEEQHDTPETEYDGGFCPRTWDGVSCFQDTISGTEVDVQCPSYYIADSFLASGGMYNNCVACWGRYNYKLRVYRWKTSQRPTVNQSYYG